MDNSIDWNAAGHWVAAHVSAVAGTVGITGLGIGFIKFLRHVPAPKKGSVWAGCLFDTFQDLASNDSRIGERRTDTGEATSSAAAQAEPESGMGRGEAGPA